MEIELSAQSHELPLGKSVLLEELGDDLQVPLVTHRFKLDEIEAAYDLFGHQRDGILKVAITP